MKRLGKGRHTAKTKGRGKGLVHTTMENIMVGKRAGKGRRGRR
jgi:hypothetical protein